MTQILLCGGTIDKTYFPNTEIFDFSETHFYEMMKQSRITGIDLEISEVFQKDSLFMNDADRKTISDACKNSMSHKILIIHGTSTMTETAEYIQKHLFSKNKTIVLFGALYPFEYSKSDALFNFGSAITAVQLLDHGCYITMNGKIWKAGKVKKDVDAAVFVEKK